MKMKISVVLAHPNEKSFNHAIAAAAVETLNQNGHEVSFHDLYKEKFDSLLPFEEFFKDAPLPPEIEKHCNEISTADAIIVVHPNWWGQPPAILKGWVDRVFRPGVAYEFQEGDKGDGALIGLLKAQTGVVFNTSNTESEREMVVFGDPLETIWKNCIFRECGVQNFYRKNFGIIVVSTKDQRKQWLKEVRQTVNEYFPKAGT
jgi:putative NADPH-quinone reductase